MRIRTIKPEFWTHPVMSRQPDALQLLAIALLNYADDEGYFYADPDLIRGAIAPRKQSVKIHGMISELSQHGYLELREHPTHGLLGRIVSFADHQVINRPKASKVRELWQSLSDHGSITDSSLLEGKGMERNGRDRFTPPTLEEISEYAQTIDSTFTEHDRFRDFYSSKGWKVGNTPMKDWKAALRNWIRGDKKGQGKKLTTAEQNGF